ncbi:MAG: hypothetical protein WBJ50_03260, partial [Smithellaceae bacterium]
LFDYALALGTLPRPRGNGVVIQTHSGGPGATAADSCGRVGLKLPRLSDETVKKLQPLIPKTASTANPVDMTFSKNHADDYFGIPDAILQDDQVDMLLAYFVSPTVFIERILGEMGSAPDAVPEETDNLVREFARQFISLTGRHPDKPIVGFTYRSLQETMVRTLLDNGVPVYQEPERAARSLAALLEYYKKRDEMIAAGK